MGDLHRAGVEVLTFLRLYGVDGPTVFFPHTASGEPVILEGADTLIHVHAQQSLTTLGRTLDEAGVTTLSLGDALAPRTVEEAIHEGLMAGLEL